MTHGSTIASYTILLLCTFVSIFPFYFMFISGTNTNVAILSAHPKLTVGTELLKNLTILSEKIRLGRSIFNSLYTSMLYTLLSAIIFPAAGFALAKYRFRGQKLIFAFIMGSMMIPSMVMYVPLFEMMIRLNMTDTYASVIFPLLANAFGIFLLKQNIESFPTALLEASRIDGLNELSIFARIVMPNIKPALGALVIYMFTSMWNNFMWPLIVLGSKEKYTLPISLAMLDGNPTNKNYAVILLAAAVATAPILIVFFIFQKQFVAGVMGGAIKE